MTADELVAYLRAEAALKRLLERLKEQTAPRGPIDDAEYETTRG